MRITTSLNRLRFGLLLLTLAATTLTACQIKQAPKTQSLYQSPKTMSYNDTLSQIIANAPDSIEATEAHYRLGLIKMAEHRQNEALGHFISASRQPDHFPWNIASEIEITGMNMSSDPSIFETLSAKKALLEKNTIFLISMFTVQIFTLSDGISPTKIGKPLSTPLRRFPRFR